MEVRLDLGNIPSVLAAFSDLLLAQRIVNVAAESYTDDTLDWIDAGRAFATDHGEVRDDSGRIVVHASGQLQQSIGWHGNGNGSATVYANADYAMYVENGTRPHVIRPRDRKALRFPVSGGAGFGFAKVINHPGTAPHPFFFTDRDHRMDNMQSAALSVLGSAIGGLNG